MPQAGDEPCCDIGARRWFPMRFPFLIPVDFPVLCVRDAPDASDSEDVT